MISLMVQTSLILTLKLPVLDEHVVDTQSESQANVHLNCVLIKVYNGVFVLSTCNI